MSNVPSFKPSAENDDRGSGDVQAAVAIVETALASQLIVELDRIVETAGATFDEVRQCLNRYKGRLGQSEDIVQRGLAVADFLAGTLSAVVHDYDSVDDLPDQDSKF